MPKREEKEVIVTERGLVAGAGVPRPDDEALAILDDRFHTSEPEVPDIGVVIDSRHVPKELSAGPIDQPSDTWIFDPGPYTDFSLWERDVIEKFGPAVPKQIIFAKGLETPIRAVIEQPRAVEEGGWVSDLTFTVWLRLLFQHGLIDLRIDKEQIERPGVTLLDLVEHQED